MGDPGADELGRRECEGAVGRKSAARQRLAEALRANLSRRKAQSRDRRSGEASQKDMSSDKPAESDSAAKHN